MLCPTGVVFQTLFSTVKMSSETPGEKFLGAPLKSFGLLFHPTFPSWKMLRVCETHGTMDGTSLPVAVVLSQNQVLFVGVFAG